VRHSFQALPAVAGRSRPVIDVTVDGLQLAPQACLIDTGASDVRMGAHVAELAGVDLTTAASCEIVVGGLRTTGKAADVQLELRETDAVHVWTATVYFCEPWRWAFGLLGLGGLDPFLVIVDSYEEWLELRRVDR
jgi:hypothetical protein